MKCVYNEKDVQNLSEIKKFLDDNKVEYSTEKDNFCLWYDNPNGRRSYEIEYVPSYLYPIAYSKYNIEGVDKGYFFKLSQEAEENNSFKLWIKDYEWENQRKREVLKSYILHASDKTTNRIYARDCEVREVDTKIGSKFETENCFYGKRGASLRLGLFLKKEKYGLPKDSLIMIYSFGKNFFGKDNYTIEIIRVGTLKFHTVVGGPSKLLKHFLKNYKEIQIGKNLIKVKRLKFYSDYDHNIGNSLEKMGFTFLNYSKGGFMNFWLETGEIKHREPMRHKWVMEQKSKGKCLAIPNAGTKNFIMELD